VAEKNTKFVINTWDNRLGFVEYPLDIEVVKENIDIFHAATIVKMRKCNTSSEIKSLVKEIDQFDQRLFVTKNDINRLMKDISRKASEKKSRIPFIFWWKIRDVENETLSQINELRGYIGIIDSRLEKNSSLVWELNEKQRKSQEAEITNLPELEKKFQDAIKANGLEQIDSAYKLFEECYYGGYKTTEAAEVLGLISFNEFNDIEKARIWFMRAVSLNTQTIFVYLYIGEIYQANGEGIPPEIFNKGLGKGTRVLSQQVIEKIRRLTRENSQSSVS